MCSACICMHGGACLATTIVIPTHKKYARRPRAMRARRRTCTIAMLLQPPLSPTHTKLQMQHNHANKDVACFNTNHPPPCMTQLLTQRPLHVTHVPLPNLPTNLSKSNEFVLMILGFVAPRPPPLNDPKSLRSQHSDHWRSPLTQTLID